MNALTLDLKLGSNAGFTVPEGMMGYWIKGIPEEVTQPTKEEVLQAAGDLFSEIEVFEKYKTSKRTITMIVLPRLKPHRPSMDSKDAFLSMLSKIMQSRKTEL